MIIKPFLDHQPRIHSTVRGAETAVVTGDVTLASNVNLWYGAVLRGDMASISVGENTNIQENAVLHCDQGVPCTVGCDVTIGHNAVVHSARVGDCCLIGMNATLLSGCVLEPGCVVGGGAVVPGNLHAPANSLILGVPAKVVRTLPEEYREKTLRNAQAYLRYAAQSFPSREEE